MEEMFYGLTQKDMKWMAYALAPSKGITQLLI
jgi:hypothetical protein